MSTPVFPPCQVGEVLPATSSIGKADLGKIYQIGNALYQVVKNHTAALTAPAKFILVWQDRAAFTVTTTTTASDPAVAGFVPSEVSGNIASGEYFLLRLPALGGTFTAIASAAVTATTDDGKAVVTSTTAGRVVLLANTGKTTVSVGKSPTGGAAAGAASNLTIVLNF